MAEMRYMFPLARFAASAIFVMILFSTKETSAMWVKMSVEELVKHSDLIVIGELVSLRSQEAGTFDVGTIRVEEVIIGGEGVIEASLAIPSRRGPLSSTSILYKVGQRGLWFLRRQSERETVRYLADHPQRLQPEEHVKAVLAYLLSNAKPSLAK